MRGAETGVFGGQLELAQGKPAPSGRLGLLSALALVLVSGCAAPEPAAEPPDSEPFDTIIANGRVIDPETGLDGVRHVGIRGGVIEAVSETALDDRLAPGGQRIDATDRVVAPGFIDLHAHGQSETANLYQARDGVTTALELEGGVLGLEEWVASRRGKAPIHFGASVSEPAARAIALQPESERADLEARMRTAISQGSEAVEGIMASIAPTAYEDLPNENHPILRSILEEGLREGGLGIGLPHQYTPGADRQEVLEVFRLSAELEAPIYTHVRSMSLDAMQEVLANAVGTGAPLHIVHVNSMSLGEIETVLELIAGARARGLDVTTEAYPYTAASTYLQSALFDEGWQDRLGISYGDLQWESTGERLTGESFARYREQGGKVIIHMMKEEWIDHAMATPFVMVASDGMPYAPGAHPRSAGTFARVLGRYVRERGTLDLPLAIEKMTLMPARRLEAMAPAMRRKGRVQVGADADLTVFDPERVIDTATFEEDLSFSEGIEHVLVLGTAVVRDGEIVEGVYPGQPVLGRYLEADAPPRG